MQEQAAKEAVELLKKARVFDDDKISQFLESKGLSSNEDKIKVFLEMRGDLLLPH